MTTNNMPENSAQSTPAWQTEMEKLKLWWSSLQLRERRVLTLGGLAISLIVFYALIWQPWHAAINHMEEVLPLKRQELIWMRQQAASLASGATLAEPDRVAGQEQSLMSVLEQSARASGVRNAIQQLVPRQEAGEVSVVLEDVSFNRWVRWIDTLETNYAVSITQLTAERDPQKPDIAEIRVTFSR